ncbi:MAG TPA: helix-turn-helix domain-containing protein [Streptosporangiaceae bacterium]|nr:helix-turn-helix domain-containing protein [Streptosporangiaceae bacterium]
MGRVDYHERPAPPGLGLHCLWSQAAPAAAEPYVQRVVPDACIDLIWSDWDGDVHVAGPDTGPFLTGIPPGGRLTGARFRPGLAAAALGVPADALTDGRVPLRALWGGAADALAAALADAVTTGGDPAATLTGAVAARLRITVRPADPAVPALVSALAAGDSVRAAARRLGLSERQLRRRSLAAFGYGPKTLQRILRFQRALARARAGTPAADVAHATGYADQAHFAHEVRELAGVPLTELLGPAEIAPAARP